MQYDCPICKKAPKRGRYQRTWRWKTQRGLDNHYCYATELENRAKAAEREVQRQAAELAAWQARACYKVGDRRAFVYSRVTAPTHQTKFGRQVRVRYKELREYMAAEGEIVAVVADGYEIATRNSANRIVREEDIYANIETALMYAKIHQQAYDAAVKFAENVR